MSDPLSGLGFPSLCILTHSIFNPLPLLLFFISGFSFNHPPVILLFGILSGTKQRDDTKSKGVPSIYGSNESRDYFHPWSETRAPDVLRLNQLLFGRNTDLKRLVEGAADSRRVPHLILSQNLALLD